MLNWLSAIPLALWLEQAGFEKAFQITVTLQQNTSRWVNYDDRNTDINAIVNSYVKSWSQKGFGETNQGLWIQSGEQVLVDRQGATPFPGASLTKIVTTLAALKHWGPYHQFNTEIGITGSIAEGVVQGDLVVIGGGDPLFIWQEAIAIGQTLNQQGITQVTGDLIITGSMGMNYNSDPTTAGALFRRSINKHLWDRHLELQYRSLPHDHARPQIAIAGNIRLKSTPPPVTRLLRHQSIPLIAILKRMNVHSHNRLSQTIADALGGADTVQQSATRFAGIPPEEVQIINGSGLGVDNRLSARASVMLLMAIQRYLQLYHLSLADIFPVVGEDIGTLIDRSAPPASIVKTGTLSTVSALAGVIFTSDRPLVWFSIINRGGDIEGFRVQQDELLHALAQHWGGVATPPDIMRSSDRLSSSSTSLGNLSRNRVVW